MSKYRHCGILGVEVKGINMVPINLGSIRCNIIYFWNLYILDYWQINSWTSPMEKSDVIWRQNRFVKFRDFNHHKWSRSSNTVLHAIPPDNATMRHPPERLLARQTELITGNHTCMGSARNNSPIDLWVTNLRSKHPAEQYTNSTPRFVCTVSRY